MFNKFTRTIAPLLAIGFASVAVPSTSFAWTQGSNYVVGTVAEVMITAAGSVAVDFGDDETNRNYYVCGLAYQRNDVKMETCEGWLKLLTAAQLAGKSVRVEYDGVVDPGDGKAILVRLYP